MDLLEPYAAGAVDDLLHRFEQGSLPRTGARDSRLAPQHPSSSTVHSALKACGLRIRVEGAVLEGVDVGAH